MLIACTRQNCPQRFSTGGARSNIPMTPLDFSGGPATWGLGFRAEGLKFRVQGVGFRIYGFGFGFRVYGSAFRAYGFGRLGSKV